MNFQDLFLKIFIPIFAPFKSLTQTGDKTMNIKNIFSILTLTAFLSLGTALAGDGKNPSPTQSKANENVENKVNQEGQDIAKDKRKDLEEDALIALDKTSKALKALDENKSDEALKLLSEVSTKLEKLIKDKPELANAPMAVSLETYDAVIDLSTILETQRIATHLLIDGEIQAVKTLLEPIRSEMVVTTTSLPLATYPDAIAEITPLINDGKTEEAKQALQTVLGTVVIEEEILPLSILRAEMFIKLAEIKAKIKRNALEQGELNDLFSAAIYELAIAEAMGYGDADTYAEFAKEISKIKEETNNKKASSGFFDTIKDLFHSFGSKEANKSLEDK